MRQAKIGMRPTANGFKFCLPATPTTVFCTPVVTTVRANLGAIKNRRKTHSERLKKWTDKEADKTGVCPPVACSGSRKLFLHLGGRVLQNAISYLLTGQSFGSCPPETKRGAWRGAK